VAQRTRKKNRSEAQETKLLEHATFDDEHQSTRGFPYPDVHNIPVGIVYFVFKFEVIQHSVDVPKV